MMSPILLSLAVKGTLVLAIAALAVALLRRSPASLRHCIWAVAFTALLALPVLEAFGPTWHVAVLPTETVTPAIPAPEVRVPPSETPTPQRAPADEASASPLVPAPLVPGLEPQSDEISTSASTWTDTTSRAGALMWLGRLWGMGVLVVGLFWLRGCLLGRRLVREAETVSDPTWLARAGVAAQASGLQAPVRLLRSDAFSVPVAWGWGHPTVVLPFQSDTWDAERADAVLIHEMAHLRRRDAWTQAIAQAALALHWPNPLAWMAYRRFIDAREEACDDAVLRVGAMPTDYATHLIAVARELAPSRLRLAAVAPMASRSGLETRVRSILDRERPRRQLGGWALSATLLLTGTLGGLLAAVHPVPATAASIEIPAPRTAPSTPDVRDSDVAVRDTGEVRQLVMLGNEGRPLTERWREAREIDEVQIAWPAWMVWGIENPTIQTLRSNAPGGDWDGSEEHASFSQTVSDVLPDALPNVLFLVKLSERGAVEAIRLRSPEVPVDLVDQTVFWLGPATDADSRALFDRLYDETRDPELRSEIAAATAIHADSRAVIDAVGRMIQNDPSPIVREEAAEWLPRGHPTAPGVVPVLVQAIEADASESVRHEATEALAEVDLPSARSAVERFASSHPDPGVRSEAIEGIVEAQARGPQPVATLVQTIEEDTRKPMRFEALDRLRSLNTESAWAAIRQLASTHPDATLRREAVEALARVQAGSPETVATLLRIVDTDSEEAVQREAVETLADLNTPDAWNAVQRLSTGHPDARIRREAIEGLAKARPDSPETLAALLKAVDEDADIGVRREAVEAIADLNSPRARDAIRQLAGSHAHPEVRSEAVEALVLGDSPETVSILVGVVEEDADSGVRQEAIEALADLDTADAWNAIRRFSESHPDVEVRVEAAESLARR
ncbi:MAG: hypothetical protein Rubg2KO_11280 [Rubricoccaceae bacterium]